MCTRKGSGLGKTDPLGMKLRCAAEAHRPSGARAEKDLAPAKRSPEKAEAPDLGGTPDRTPSRNGARKGRPAKERLGLNVHLYVDPLRPAEKANPAQLAFLEATRTDPGSPIPRPRPALAWDGAS